MARPATARNPQTDLFGGGDPMPPYVRRSDTSKAAAISMVADAKTIREAVFAYVRNRHGRGATCHEVEWGLKLSHQTASARLRELALANRVKDSGARRPTASGRKAVVWIASPAPVEAAQEETTSLPTPASRDT